MAANASVAAARLGGIVHYWGRVGDGGMVGVTLGPDGFLWLDAGHERRARPPRVVAVDTLAAGDVFHAAFALAIGEGRAIVDAAAFANAAAALKCTRFGGRLGAPARAKVEALLRSARGE